jgi:hypothetical protein
MSTLGVTVNTETALSQLLADPVHIQREITVKAGAGALSRGQVMALNTSTWLWQALATSGSNNENVARAILAEDLDNNASATQKAQAYLVGRYRYDDLVWANGQTAAQKRQALLELQDRGAVVDEPLLEATMTTTTTTTTTT